MCFYNSMSKKAIQLAARYGRKSDVVEIYQEILDERYNVSAFTNPQWAVITKDTEIQVYTWGLIPFWVKPKGNTEIERKEAVEKADSIRKGTYNARAETIFELPSFRAPIRNNRCIIPSTGYFEYHHNTDGTTTPYFIYLKDEPIFSMAGIYDSWLNPETEKEEYTFSMITTEANVLTGEIHNGGRSPHRMPLILPKDKEEGWLIPGLTELEIKSFLKIYPDNDMEAYMVNPDFRKKNQHDKTILKKAG